MTIRDGYIRLNFDVPKLLAEQFRAAAAANDRSVSAELRRLVQAYLDGAKPKRKR